MTVTVHPSGSQDAVRLAALPLDPFQVPLSGMQLIEASAGTGKTHTITTLYVRLLLEGRCRINQILVVTFTNAATAELRQRVRDRLRRALDIFEGRSASIDPELAAVAKSAVDSGLARRRLAVALSEIDQAAIFTIHGFCQQVLQEYAFESGVRFDSELVTDPRPLIAEIAQDYSTEKRSGAPLAAVSYLAERGVTLASLVALCRMAVAWPDVPFEPRVELPSLASEVDAYLSARAALARTWKDCRPAVLDVLRGLGPPYNTNHVQKWTSQLDTLCRTDTETLDGWFDRVRKFTTREIRGALRGKSARLEHPFFAQSDRLVAAYSALEERLEQWRLAFEGRLVDYARSEFARRKQERGLVTFDDLLHELRRALTGPNGALLTSALRKRFPAALIDEFHDTDAVQYDIFSTIYDDPQTALFLIGDPKQAIYAFRGADVFAYLTAVRGASARWSLAVNRRSDPGIVGAVNALFSRPSSPFVLDDIAFAPVTTPAGSHDRLKFSADASAPLEILFVRRSANGGRTKLPERDDVAALVAGEIARLLARKPTIGGRAVEPEDIAVLTRTNQQARDIQTELQERGIVSALQGDSNVFESDEARDLGYVLRALAEPSTASAVKSALATSLLGLDANELFSLRDDATWERWIADFYRWHEIWETRGFVESIRRMMTDTRATARILKAPGGERRLTNFLHLIELVQKEAVERRLKTVGLVQWFDDARRGLATRDGALAPEAQQIRLESDEKAVQLTTMHRSKGLEYPIVYCPYLFDGAFMRSTEERYLRYHDPADRYRLKVDLRSKEAKEEALAAFATESLAENLRLLYVALTRAKHHCVVVWGAYKGCDRSALGYLLHPAESHAFASPAATRIASMDDDAMLRDLQRLVGAAGCSIGVRISDGVSTQRYEGARAKRTRLEARTMQRQIAAAHRISSYSGLVSASASRDTREVRDVDALLEALPAPLADRSSDRPAALIRLHDFPRGAGPGELIHRVLEQIDFGANRALWSDVTERECRRYGLDPKRWLDTLLDALSDMTNCPLDPGCGTFRLRDVPLESRRSEMEFALPVRRGSASSLTALRIAEAMSHAERLPPEYIDRLRRLQFAPLVGFLRGYIDLVFEHAGRFYLVDYKSNFLGPTPDDYGASQMQRAMSGHHYFLQYYVYGVALHRHLARRLRAYDFERHFGGVFYLFIRGMSPDVAGRGVFFDRPPFAVIDKLDRTLQGLAQPEVRP